MRYIEASVTGEGLKEVFEGLTEKILTSKGSLRESDRLQAEDTAVAYRKDKKQKDKNLDHSASDNEDKKNGPNMS